jgi:hypothetical protein
MNRLRTKGKMNHRSKQKRKAGGTHRKDVTVNGIATIPDLKLGTTKQAGVDGWRRLKQSHIPTGFITKIHAPRCEVRPFARVVSTDLICHAIFVNPRILPFFPVCCPGTNGPSWRKCGIHRRDGRSCKGCIA